jgi:hypothetical protein
MWTGLHFSGAAKNSLNLILVERLEPTSSGRMMPPLWLVWTGECTMSLEDISNQYLRRFGIEHWYRFALTKTALDDAQLKDTNSR